MTQNTAYWLAGAIIALLIADAIWLGWQLPYHGGRLLIGVVEWMAFWR